LVRNLFGAAINDAVARWNAGGLMNAMTTLIFVLVATGQQSAEGTQNDEAAKAKSQRLLELHTNDAASYSMVSSAGTDPEIILMLESRKSGRAVFPHPAFGQGCTHILLHTFAHETIAAMFVEAGVVPTSGVGIGHGTATFHYPAP
jgi:hypothetical protein